MGPCMGKADPLTSHWISRVFLVKGSLEWCKDPGFSQTGRGDRLLGGTNSAPSDPNKGKADCIVAPTRWLLPFPTSHLL